MPPANISFSNGAIILRVDTAVLSPRQDLSATGKSMRFFYPIPDRQCLRGPFLSKGQASHSPFISWIRIAYSILRWNRNRNRNKERK